MKLTFYRGPEPNFGDELNALLWDHLLPSGFLDESEDELFLGIGSILWDYLPSAPTKHVVGSGYGGYSPPPNVHDGSWNIVWVRGPQTAKTLGIDPELAITDAAVLLRAIPLPDPATGIDVAFMPHFQSIARGDWAKVCEIAGITYLDPRADPITLIAQIRGARLVLTEAMHGAIVADALRTPFIPFIPHHPEHRAKWEDWSASLQIELRSQPLPVSTAIELYVNLTGAPGRGKRSQWLRSHAALRPLHNMLTHRAARHLKRIAATVPPQLSDDTQIIRATTRCLDALECFVMNKRNRR